MEEKVSIKIINKIMKELKNIEDKVFITKDEAEIYFVSDLTDLMNRIESEKKGDFLFKKFLAFLEDILDDMLMSLKKSEFKILPYSSSSVKYELLTLLKNEI